MKKIVTRVIGFLFVVILGQSQLMAKSLYIKVINSDSYSKYKSDERYHNLPLKSKFYVDEFLEVLNLNQQDTIIWAYKTGRLYGYGYTLSAISWKESMGGYIPINLFDKPWGSCGIFHNNLKTVVNFEKLEGKTFIVNHFNLNKLCASLQNDPEYSLMEAIKVLDDAKRRYKNDWMKIWAHYNGGFSHPNFNYAKDIYYRIQALKFIFELQHISNNIKEVE